MRILRASWDWATKLEYWLYSFLNFLATTLICFFSGTGYSFRSWLGERDASYSPRDYTGLSLCDGESAGLQFDLIFIWEFELINDEQFLNDNYKSSNLKLSKLCTETSEPI